MSWKLYFFAFALVLASLLLSLFAVEHSAYVTPPFVGLILSSIIVLLFSKTRYRLFPARAQGVWGAIVLLFSAIAFLAPFGILFQLGLVSFTYADGGLEPTYFSSITWHVVIAALGVIFGLEYFFRQCTIDFLCSAGWTFLQASGLQALLSVAWLAIAFGESLFIAETSLVLLFLCVQVFATLYAGLLYCWSKSILLTGAWTMVQLLPEIFVMSDIEFGFGAAYYFVTSSHAFYFTRIAIVAMLCVAAFFRIRSNELAQAR